MSLATLLEDQNPWWREPRLRVARRFPLRRPLQQSVFRQLARLEDRRAVVVLGPRQVGKTTLLLQTVDDLLEQGVPATNLTYFDFADDRLLGQPAVDEVMKLQVPGASPDHPRYLLLDEISRAPRWDLWLKRVVDRLEARVAASDSAASLLRQGGTESGQGRWDELWLETLSFTEFLLLQARRGESAEDVYSRSPDLLERYFLVGGFPEHALPRRRSDEGGVGDTLQADLLDVRRRLRTDVVDRAILRDLAGRVGDPTRARDLFVYLVQESGGELSAKKRAPELEADARTVRTWASLLLDTFLLCELQQSTSHAAESLRSLSKIYASDHGLITAFSPLPDPASDPRVRSRIFEAVAFRHLRDLARDPLADLQYLRQGKKNAKREVDFVLRLDRRTIAIEVTSRSTVPAEKLRRAAEAASTAEADHLVVLHGGIEERTTREGTHLLPMRGFLLDPATILRGVD